MLLGKGSESSDTLAHFSFLLGGTSREGSPLFALFGARSEFNEDVIHYAVTHGKSKRHESTPYSFVFPDGCVQQ